MNPSPIASAWASGPFLFEHYQFAPSPIAPLPPHAHEAIQFCLNSGSGGQYHYRRAYHAFAPGSLTAINSGEAHAPGYKGHFETPTSFRIFYVEPASLHQLARDLRGSPVDEPYFSSLVLTANSPAQRLLQQAHEALETNPAGLETDIWLLLFQVSLLRYHVQDRLPQRMWTNDQSALRRVREYLHEHATAKIMLAELADIACLSEYHLCHAFSQHFGVAPHQYLTQLRVDRAKRLLLAGTPVSDVARQTGFYDNSHLLRHFRRIVGVLPSRYP